MTTLSGRRRRGAVALAAGVVLALAGCNGDGGDVGVGAGGTTTTDGSTTSAPAATTTTAATTSIPATTVTTTAAPVVLRPDGFGSSTFEDDTADAVVAAATALLGPPIDDAVNNECGAGPLRIVRWDDLRLTFLAADDGFAGYHWSATPVPIETEAGITIGSTVAQLQAAYPDVEVMTQTLGPEWLVPFGEPLRFLAGFLTSTDPAGTVTDIYAGTQCFFR